MSATPLPRVGTAEVDLTWYGLTDQYSVHGVDGENVLVQKAGDRPLGMPPLPLDLPWWETGVATLWRHRDTFTRVHLDRETPYRRPPLPEVGAIATVRADHCRWCEQIALDPHYRKDSRGADLGGGAGWRAGARFAATHPVGYPWPLSNCRGDDFFHGFHQGAISRWCPAHPFDPPNNYCLASHGCVARVFSLGAYDAMPAWIDLPGQIGGLDAAPAALARLEGARLDGGWFHFDEAKVPADLRGFYGKLAAYGRATGLVGGAA